MTPGTAYVKYHHLIGSIKGHQGAWGFVRGGMGAVSRAIAAAGIEHGLQIATDSEVAEIDIQDGSAKGRAHQVMAAPTRQTSSSPTPTPPAPFWDWLARASSQSHLPAGSGT